MFIYSVILRLNMSTVIKKFTIPFGLIFAFIGIIANLIAIIYPWAFYDEKSVLAWRRMDILILIIISMSLVLEAIYLNYSKNINPIPLILASGFIDITSLAYISMYYLKYSLGYFLTLIASIIKGLSCLMLIYKIGEIEIEIIKEE